MAHPGSNAVGVDNTFRRKWNKEEYLEKAREREEQDEEGRLKNKGKAPPVQRKPLKHRDFEVDLSSRLGKTQVVTPIAPLSQQAGFFCDVCECVVKDSANYLDHINGKKHQRVLGMSMRVERASLQQVQERFESLKKRKTPGSFTEQGKDLKAHFETWMRGYKNSSKRRKRGNATPRKEEGKEGHSDCCKIKICILQKSGTSFSGTPVGGSDVAGQHSFDASSTIFVSYPQEADISSYRTHSSQASQYGGQYAAVYASSAMGTAQQAGGFSAKVPGSSSLQGRTTYASALAESSKFSAGGLSSSLGINNDSYVPTSSLGYTQKGDQYPSVKGSDYSSMDRRSYIDHQGAYIGRDLQNDPSRRFSDTLSNSHLTKSETHDHVDQASVIRQQQTLNAQSLQAGPDMRQADYFAATTGPVRHGLQEFSSYGGRMDVNPRSSSILGGTPYVGQHPSSILGGAPRRNVDEHIYPQGSSSAGYGVALPPGRDYATGKGLHGLSVEPDYQGKCFHAVQPFCLVDADRDYLSLSKRYPRLSISPEFSKVILMSGISSGALEGLCSEKCPVDRVIHLKNILKFGLLKKDQSFMAIGGPWSAAIDGGDPSVDESTLIQTAIRWVKEIAGLDLHDCLHWNRFLEIHYHRVGKDGFFSHKEITVLFIPNLSNCLPSVDLWRSQWLAYKRNAVEREQSSSLKQKSSKENIEVDQKANKSGKDDIPAKKLKLKTL
ncbi:hypothetical protein J5N97_014075 [Dioscorea zingiberensis]|uniref:U1-type domain-containing protein n=1 Tax=Dioscorea zingiberensis TaxID=325984 RepID=A0A9D5HJC8_9LILI|nr:hypothetical protein J5N97_014075 [Dioscorea zingiberensis]